MPDLPSCCLRRRRSGDDASLPLIDRGGGARASLVPPTRYLLITGLRSSGKTAIAERLARAPDSADGAIGRPRPSTAIALRPRRTTGGTTGLLIVDTPGAARGVPDGEALVRAADAVVFAVDSADRLQLQRARRDLDWVLERTPARRPVMLLLTKADLAASRPAHAVASDMGLDRGRHDRVAIAGPVSLGDGRELARLVDAFEATCAAAAARSS